MQLSSTGAARAWRAEAPSWLCWEARQERGTLQPPCWARDIVKWHRVVRCRRELSFLAAESSPHQSETSGLVGTAMGGSHGPWRRVEGSCPPVFLRGSLGEPEAELSGWLAAPRFSAGIMHTLHMLAQYGAKSKTSARALGQQCPPISVQKSNARGEEGWRLGQKSTSRANVPPS